jgi:hypothetical protein
MSPDSNDIEVFEHDPAMPFVASLIITLPLSAPSADTLELSIEQPIFLVDQLSQTILVLLTVVLNQVACRLPMSGSAWLDLVVQPISPLCLIGRDVVQM